MFLGAYPITPASDVLHELARFRHFGIKTFQAEDEIAAISAAIGASFAGSLGICTTSGPGMVLKQEALGLAEPPRLPQRSGPADVLAQQPVELFGERGIGAGGQILALERFDRRDEGLGNEAAPEGAEVAARVGIAASEPVHAHATCLTAATKAASFR